MFIVSYTLKNIRKVYKRYAHLRHGIMKPGYVLTIILASVLILSFAIVLLKGDVLQSQPEIKPPSSLSIRDVDVKPIEVTSSLIEVNVTAYINHYGGKTQNATMLIRAISRVAPVTRMTVDN